MRSDFEIAGGVYTFTDAKPYYRLKKNGKWTWVAAEVIHSGWDNYVIRKIREVPPSGLPKMGRGKAGEAKQGVETTQSTTDPLAATGDTSDEESP